MNQTITPFYLSLVVMRGGMPQCKHFLMRRIEMPLSKMPFR